MMPLLPSGRVVGISNERARYHAARRNLSVTRDTPLEQLYPLIDILIADAADSPDLWYQNYRFSGHTLADRAWLNEWDAGDRKQFQQWLLEKSQRNEIEGARNKLIYDAVPQEILSHPYPQQLYSLLHHRIEAMNMSRATVQQWRNTIRNMGKCGIREEEMQWSSLMGFLERHRQQPEHMLDKVALLQALDFSGIRMELTNERHLQAPPALGFVKSVQMLDRQIVQQAGVSITDDELTVQHYIEPELGYRLVQLRRRDWRNRLTAMQAGSGSRWLVFDASGQALATQQGDTVQADLVTAQGLAADHAYRQGGTAPMLKFGDRYEYVSLAGGEDYREWLITLPDYPRTLYTQHYTERNVLVHIRSKLREDEQGRRLLFIEEIQSDWHQRSYRGAHAGHNGRRSMTEVPIAPFRKEWVALALKMMLMHASHEGLQGIAWTPGAIQQIRYAQDSQAIARLYDREIPAVLQQLSAPWQGEMGQTQIVTRDPNWRMQRSGSAWLLVNEQAGYRTRPRLDRDKARQLYRQHARPTQLAVPVLIIPQAMQAHIRQHGLPLFGVNAVDPVARPLCGVSAGPAADEAAMRARCERCLSPSSSVAGNIPPPGEMGREIR